MNKDLEKFFNKLKQIELSGEERVLLRNRLSEYVLEYKPEIKKSEKIQTPFFSFYFRWQVVAYAFAVFIFVGTGTSMAASRSVPGNTLYPVKTNLNEKIQLFLAVSEESKAEVDARIAEVRLIEVEQLAKEGKLDTNTRLQLENAFEKKADSFDKRIKKLEAEKGGKKQEKFERALEIREEALRSIVGEDEEKESEVRPVIEKVRSKIKREKEKDEAREEARELKDAREVRESREDNKGRD